MCPALRHHVATLVCPVLRFKASPLQCITTIQDCPHKMAKKNSIGSVSGNASMNASSPIPLMTPSLDGVIQVAPIQASS
ncbi:hypothetical protein VNO78_07787 [Psophocarpus tetragonolobus]|uniref:Uncharacterized protein n=1 Tax=Psophocarpus tetragonolobus TaxID=3891 RepID=A0AAN9T3S9_PSOTE